MRREWQQCRKEKNEEEFSSTENIRATSENTERHRFVTNTGNTQGLFDLISPASFLSIFTTHLKRQHSTIFFYQIRIYYAVIEQGADVKEDEIPRQMSG